MLFHDAVFSWGTKSHSNCISFQKRILSSECHNVLQVCSKSDCYQMSKFQSLPIGVSRTEQEWVLQRALKPCFRSIPSHSTGSHQRSLDNVIITPSRPSGEARFLSFPGPECPVIIFRCRIATTAADNLEGPAPEPLFTEAGAGHLPLFHTQQPAVLLLGYPVAASKESESGDWLRQTAGV